MKTKSPAKKKTTASRTAKAVGSGRLVRPIGCWAVAIKSTRSEWIHYGTIARTKSDAWERYRDQWGSAKYADDDMRSGRARLIRVVVSHDQPNTKPSDV